MQPDAAGASAPGAFDVSAAIARGKENPSWIPLESNPEALNTFARGIGLL